MTTQELQHRVNMAVTDALDGTSLAECTADQVNRVRQFVVQELAHCMTVVVAKLLQRQDQQALTAAAQREPDPRRI